MVFKRRDRRPYWQILRDVVWPRGGWTRAFHYVKHRLRRLPDSPEKIARGVFAGLFTVFTPLFGMHFVVAGLLALIVRGNILAAILATFVSNPVTFVPIALLSLQIGYLMLGKSWPGQGGGADAPGATAPDGTPRAPEIAPGLLDLDADGTLEPHPLAEAGTNPVAADPDLHHSLGGVFIDAADDLKNNFLAVFTDAPVDWEGLRVFYHEIFLPYLVGGVVPGLVLGIAGYYFTVPVIRAYQARRRGVLKAKLAAIRARQGGGKSPAGQAGGGMNGAVEETSARQAAPSARRPNRVN